MLKALQDKHNTYLELIKSAQESSGFIQSDECDSLLFSGLVGCVPGVKVDIDAAFDNEKQQWQRRPTTLPVCYDCSEPWILKDRLIKMYEDYKANGFDKNRLAKIFEKGGSSISRDMLMGLAWYTWRNKRLDISEQIIKYALSNKFIMGQGSPTRTFLTPGLLATWAEISYRLGGPNRWWLRYIPQAESKSVTGFQAHLSVLHCLLREELTGKLNDVVLHHAKREPNNPLFQVAVKDYDSAILILMDSRLWPTKTLPTSANYKEPWLVQRDYGLDWQPTADNPPKVHSGGDFLFCSSLILKKIGDY